MKRLGNGTTAGIQSLVDKYLMGREKTTVRIFSVVSSESMRGNGHTEIQETPFKHKKVLLYCEGGLNTGTSCPERSRRLHLWRHSTWP